MPTLLDFDLRLERHGDAYRARVQRSPAGEANAEFSLPFSADELRHFTPLADRVRNLRPAIADAAPRLSPRDFGERLFAAVFQGDVATSLASSLTIARQRDSGLRIRLRMNDTPELAELPWEYLYDPAARRYLALSDTTPVVRYLELAQSEQPLAVTRPLRILALISDPSGVPKLDVEREWARLQDALAELRSAGAVELDRLPNATLPELQSWLRQHETHILHYIGHGSFSPEQESGDLYLEDEAGSVRPVGGDVLGTLLHDHQPLRLAFLNACEGARAGESDPFNGVAQHLVYQGVPAVLAMQFPVSDSAAISLSQEFYRSLADGYGVDAAVVEARKAIYAQGNEREWATPVLFTRAPDGQLFDISGLSSDAPEAGEPPYKGMAAFDTGDADIFYGREALTAELAGHLRPRCFLAVIGASGSGKSSLVRAGLIPALRKGEALDDGTQPPEGSANWPYHIITPTAHPLKSLAATLTRDSESVTAQTTLMDDMVRDPRSLDLYISRLLAREESVANRLFLLVDQFEEIFTQARDKEERTAFVDNLLYAVTESDNATIVITLRADFYANCAEFDNLRIALESNQKFIGAMSRDELRRAIEEPVTQGGWEYEPGVVELLLDDVENEPGALPLLSHALLETWKRRRGRTLTFSGYQASGRVQGAIAQTADTVLAQQLTAEQQPIVRNIFLRLTELGEGSQDTRRRVSLDELAPHGEEEPTVQAVLQTLADARLITVYAGEAEVAHEALIREWPTLRTWLTEDREALRIHRRLTEAAGEWQALREDPGALYRGVRLEQATEWVSGHESDLNDLERRYLDVSLAAVAADQAAEEAAEAEKEAVRLRELETQRALAAAAEEQAKQERVAAMRLRWLLGAVVIMLLLALAGGVYIFSQNDQLATQSRQLEAQRDQLEDALANAEAERARAEIERVRADAQAAAAEAETRRADAQAAVAESEKERAQKEALRARASELAVYVENAMETVPEDPSLALILAYEAVTATVGTDAVSLNANNALREAIQVAPAWRMNLPHRRHSESIRAANFSPDGDWVVTASSDDTARIWNAATGNHLQTLVGHTKDVLWSEFDANGERVVTTSQDRTARIWDANTGESLATLFGHAEPVRAAHFDPAGQRIVTMSDDGTARIWDVESGETLAVLPGHEKRVTSASFSPDGARILTASFDGTARIWDAASGEQLALLAGHSGKVLSAAFSPGGSQIVTSGDDRTARLWDAQSGALRQALAGHEDEVVSARFSPDGQRVVTASRDHTVRIWDAVSGREEARTTMVNPELGDQDAHWPTSATFAPDGKTVAISATDGYAELWNPATENPDSDGTSQPLLGHTTTVISADFSQDGRHILTASTDGSARVWDADDGKQKSAMAGHTSGVIFAEFSPDGASIASASEDGTVRLWNVADGVEEAVLIGRQGVIRSMAFSQDGAQIVSAADDGVARLWSVASGELLHEFIDTQRRIRVADISPDGQRIATGGREGIAQLWDAGSGTKLHDLPGHEADVTVVAFSPDGSQIASADTDGAVIIWDAADGSLLTTLTGHEKVVQSVAFSPDGNSLLTAGVDETARLWNLTDGSVTELVEHGGGVTSAAFSHDGQTIVTAGADGLARLFDAATGASAGDALCCHTGRINSARFSPDGRTVLTSGDDALAQLWRVEDGELVQVLIGHSKPVRSAAFSPTSSGENDYLIVTASDDDTARVWSARSDDDQATLSGHDHYVVDASFSPDGDQIATASWDGTARLWDAASGEELRSLDGNGQWVYRAVFSPDGAQLVTTGADGVVLLWSLLEESEPLSLTGHVGKVTAAAFSPDGSQFVTAGADGAARVWDTESGGLVALLSGHSAAINSVLFSGDGAYVVTASDDMTARIWDAENGSQLHSLTGHLDKVASAAFSYDGLRIVTASDDGTARVWNAETGREIDVLSDHTSRVVSAVFSPDGEQILTASWDASAIIWDAASGAALLDLAGHTKKLVSARYSDDGRTVVTTSWDKTARIWDAQTGARLHTLTGHNNRVVAADFNPDATSVVTGSWDRTARTWSLELNHLLQVADSRISRDPPALSPDEIQRYGFDELDEAGE